MFSNLNFLTPRALESVKHSLNHNISALMRKFRCSTLVVEGGFCIQHVRIPLKTRQTIYGSVPNCLLYTYNQKNFAVPKCSRTNMTQKLHFGGGKKLKIFANISIFDPMKILISNFLQLIRVARSIWS